jgi:hypothetical protein
MRTTSSQGLNSSDRSAFTAEMIAASGRRHPDGPLKVPAIAARAKRHWAGAGGMVVVKVELWQLVD